MKCLFLLKHSNESVTQQILTYWNTKLLEIVCWFYIGYIDCVSYDIKQANIISVWYCYIMPKLVCPNFLRFCPNVWQIKTFVGALVPPALTPLPSGVRRIFSWRCFLQWHMVVICIWCALFVTSQYDVIVMFPNQRFGEVCWHNMHIFLHPLPLFHVSLHWI